ncbi:hypothetical protein BCCR75502_03283 [Burkholderia sola]|nr:hypothetical protein BCCR75386_03284 [Burkholderia cenocepacia]CAG2304659.1 hypothetical protein BCCR75387_03283 [Burkholderia cenocepacia]CAG2304669.1 hypothetical protein BCCR75384_03283 [Burkholderia cenocepacia]CAG2304682.1 hypothetical protein BCCR75388_03286 [Burkholderia cenocepacia]CAG2304688.1 hypothetical protein BCCR12632_03286 [Burkholderia cenocepacia]
MQLAYRKRTGADAHHRGSLACPRGYLSVSRAMHQRRPHAWSSILVMHFDKRRNHAYCSFDQVCHSGSAQKQMHISSASGGEAEPSPPWQVCPGCAFTQPPPPRFGMEPASPDRHFASRLYLRQRVELLTASPQCSMSPTPWRSAPRQRERQGPHHRSPSSDGAALTTRRHCARRMACTSLHSSISSTCDHKTGMSHRIGRTRFEARDSQSARKASATAGYQACRQSRLGVTSMESARCMPIIRLTSGLPCKKSMNWPWTTAIWATSTGTRWDSFSGEQRKCKRK